MVSSLKRNLETQDLQRAYEFLEKNEILILHSHIFF